MTLSEQALEAAARALANARWLRSGDPDYDPWRDHLDLHDEWRKEAQAAVEAYLSALPAVDDGLVERLKIRAEIDRKCATNSQVVVDLLQPEMDKFDLRDGEHPWNTYAVRMAVDHQNSVKRDNAWADDLEQAADTITRLLCELRVAREALDNV